jgi:conjugative relaxase-like TrwC/TraI family protein
MCQGESDVLCVYKTHNDPGGIMLSIRAMSHAGGYRSYLEKESPGYWKGSGAKLLNLPETVTPETYSLVRRGLHPETEEELRIRKVVDRVYHKPWGTEVYKARELYDLTISAPKSVSVMGIIDPKITEAHQQAVEQTWREMEQRCGPMVIAAYDHHYSRKLDPQEHTHLVAGNLSFDGEKWRTLGANNLYRGQQEITAGYREILLRKLEQQGYRIDYPELAEVPREVIARFSQRAHKRDEAIAGYIEHHGKEPSNREITILVRNHREKKQDLPAEEIRERQLARLSPVERESIVTLKERAAERERPAGIEDHVEQEAAAHHRAWSYGEKPKQRAY